MSAAAASVRPNLVIDLTAEAVAVWVARSLVRTELRNADVNDGLIDCAIPAVSQLGTNTLSHGLPPRERSLTYEELRAVPIIHATVQHYLTSTVVEAWEPDDSPRRAKVWAIDGAYEESRRWMHLVQQISIRRGHRLSAARWVVPPTPTNIRTLPGFEQAAVHLGPANGIRP